MESGLQMAAKKPDVKDWTSIDVLDPYTLRINLANLCQYPIQRPK